jgi:hypothetical protein
MKRKNENERKYLGNTREREGVREREKVSIIVITRSFEFSPVFLQKRSDDSHKSLIYFGARKTTFEKKVSKIGEIRSTVKIFRLIRQLSS